VVATGRKGDNADQNKNSYKSKIATKIATSRSNSYQRVLLVSELRYDFFGTCKFTEQMTVCYIDADHHYKAGGSVFGDCAAHILTEILAHSPHSTAVSLYTNMLPSLHLCCSRQGGCLLYGGVFKAL
jgi:hypothetical protein